jgi:triphosphoribosyl-dephospho-CoA synthase
MNAIETETPAATASMIAQHAVNALIEELHLTPKPGLVDLENSGCHTDLNLQVMTASAQSLLETFQYMALAAHCKAPSQSLREQLAAIGRYGEQQMLSVTGNVNTHKGAIWCVGLLTAAASIHVSGGRPFTPQDLLSTAGEIASFEDRHTPPKITNGDIVRKKYLVISAREEAQAGFPSLRKTALPTWETYADEPEEVRLHNVLLALMAVVDDTCILHRSDMSTLKKVQRKARSIAKNGGLNKNLNWLDYMALHQFITQKWVSPGGSADLLSATIFIKKITTHF